MNKHNEIFNKMYEKMTPSREAEDELYARAAAIERGEESPSADTDSFGGIIMNRNTMESINKTEMNTVRSRKGGIIAAAAAIALVLGIGGYAAFGGANNKLDVDGVATSPAAASEPEGGEGSEEENVADHLLAEGTVPITDETAPYESSGTMTLDEAIAKAEKLLGFTDDHLAVESSELTCDHGVEAYVLYCKLAPDEDERYTVTVPTGFKTDAGDAQDFFMTETVAGQALTDAGIAHDGFDLLVVSEGVITIDDVDHNGWYISIYAGKDQIFCYIDDNGEILEKNYGVESAFTDRPVDLERDHELIAKITGKNVEDINKLNVPFVKTEDDHGIESDLFVGEIDRKIYDFTVPTGKVTESDEPDAFMTETVAGQALTDAGVSHEGFDILYTCEDTFTRPDSEEKLSGWTVGFIANGRLYTYSIADTGEIVSKSSKAVKMEDDHGITKELMNSFSRADREEDEDGAIEIYGLSDGKEQNIIQWTVPGMYYQPLRSTLARIEIDKEGYTPVTQEAYNSSKPTDMYDVMFDGGENYYSFTTTDDGKAILQSHNKLYLVPDDVWNAAETVLNNSKPAFDLPSMGADIEINGKKYISGDTATKIAAAAWGDDFRGTTFAFTDLDYVLTGNPAWRVTLDVKSEDGTSSTQYAYIVDADASDPKIIAAKKYVVSD